MTGFDLVEMVEAYMVMAIHASASDDGEDGSVTDEHSLPDFTPEARRQAHEECRDFYEKSKPMLDIAVNNLGYSWAQAGNDLWLTRNGHGAGFWDREVLQRGNIGDHLTKLCQHKEMDVVVGDDGRLHFFGRAKAFAQERSAS